MSSYRTSVSHVVLCLCVGVVLLCQHSLGGKVTVCTTADCIAEAARIQKLLDPNADPCVDFHAYACGNFDKTRKLKPHESVGGSLFDLRVIDDNIKTNLMTQPVAHNVPNSFEVKMKNLYKSCMDTASIEKLTHTNYIQRYRDDWPTLNTKWTTNDFNLQNLYNYYAGIFTKVFFKVTLTPNHVTNPPTYEFEIDHQSFKIRDAEWKKPRNSPKVKAYEKYYTEVAVLLGANRKKAECDAKKVIDFMKKVASNFMPFANRYNPKLFKNPNTVASLNSKYNFIDWTQTLQKMLDHVNFQIKPTHSVNVMHPKYLQALTTLLRDPTYKRTIQNVFGFIQAVKVTSDASNAMRALLPKLDKEYNIPRSRTCAQVIDSLYNTGMAKLMSKDRLPAYAKNFMNELIEETKKSFNETIQKQTWLDATTKAKAILKVNKMGDKVGVLKSKFSETDMDDLYKNNVVHSNKYIQDYLQNYIQSNIRDMKYAYKPLDDNRWGISMTVVNAFYNPMVNSIFFPLGILQPPFFKKSNPRYLNYGAIGYVIGHEVGHGMDASGSQFDERGVVHNWWPAPVKAAFKAKTQCYINQYSKFVDPQINFRVSGKRSSTENLADNIALSLAYKIYKEHAKTNKELPLPNLGLSLDKLFFLSAAQVWCVKRTDDNARNQLNGNYLTSKPRINGMMQNSKEFAAAFSCPTNSFMNPSNKCKLW